jgi:hypothetical protein
MRAVALLALLLALSPASALAESLPDPGGTPGALNPAVTQVNIDETICRRGRTHTIRPPEKYTTTLKRQQLSSGPYAVPHARLRDYEEDHLVPLGLGGAPWDERDLWPQPLAEAQRKDELEGRLYHLVCAHRVTLRDAQAVFLGGDWLR